MAIDLDLTEAYDILLKDIEDNILSKNEIMIRATMRNNLESQKLIDEFEKDGLVGVYNLGLSHMYNYLKGEKNE